MISEKIDAPFRVVTIGDESVGKTSITNRIIDNTFNPHEPGTVGANYQQIEKTIDGEKITIQIWDTAGQEKFQSLSPIYFRNASAAIIVFSLVNKVTFEKLDSWISCFTEIAGINSKIFIVANKSDLVDEYEISIDEAKDWAQSRNYPLYVTSAYKGDGILQMFDDLANELFKNKDSFTHHNNNKIIDNENKGGCC